MMTTIDTNAITEEFSSFLKHRDFPCVAAKAAIDRQHVKCMVAGHMACPKDDSTILKFLYDFVDQYRNSEDLFYSAAIIFEGPEFQNEEMFDVLIWQRLQSLANLDEKVYPYDQRVDNDPNSPNFSFSLKEEAFFVIGLHPSSSRPARRFKYPALVFNPHAQFEKLRETRSYGNMKNIVRKRDLAYSGSVNPMLVDYGESSEIYQYSGRKYDDSWKCPLKINHGEAKHNTAT